MSGTITMAATKRIDADATASRDNEWLRQLRRITDALFADDDENDSSASEHYNDAPTNTDTTMLIDKTTTAAPRNDELEMELMQSSYFTGSSTIGGQAYLDANNDGMRDSFLSPTNGIPNINIWLFSCNDPMNPQALAYTKTSSNGIYRFQNLVGGRYYIIVQPPEGMEFSSSGGSSNVDAIATGGTTDPMMMESSTIDPDTGRTICFSLEDGQKSMDWSFGLYIPEQIPTLQPSTSHGPSLNPSTNSPTRLPTLQPVVMTTMEPTSRQPASVEPTTRQPITSMPSFILSSSPTMSRIPPATAKPTTSPPTVEPTVAITTTTSAPTILYITDTIVPTTSFPTLSSKSESSYNPSYVPSKPVATSQPVVASRQPVVTSKQPTDQPTVTPGQPSSTLRPSIKNSDSTVPQPQPSQPSTDPEPADPPSWSPTMTPTPFGTPWPGFSNRTKAPTTQNNGKNIGAIVGGTFAVVVVLLAVWFVWNKRRKQTTTEAESATATAAAIPGHDNHHNSIRWHVMPWKRTRAQDDDNTNHDHIHAAVPRYGTDIYQDYNPSGVHEEEEMIEFYDVEMQKAFDQEQEKKRKGSTHDDEYDDDDDDAPMNESSEHTRRTSSQSTTSIDNNSSEGIQQQHHANILPKRPESSSAPESESYSGSFDSGSCSGSYSGASYDDTQSKSYSGSSQHSGSYSGSHSSSKNSHTDKNYDDSYGDIENVGDLPLPPPKQLVNKRSSSGVEVQQQNRRISQNDNEEDVVILSLKPPAPVRQADINEADKPPPPPPIRIKLSREDPSIDSSVSHHHRLSRRFSDSSDDAASIHDASSSGNLTEEGNPPRPQKSIYIPTQSPAVGEDFAAVSEMENIKALIKEISTLEMALQAYPKHSQAHALLSSYLARANEELDAVRHDIGYDPYGSVASGSLGFGSVDGGSATARTRSPSPGSAVCTRSPSSSPDNETMEEEEENSVSSRSRSSASSSYDPFGMKQQLGSAEDLLDKEVQELNDMLGEIDTSIDHVENIYDSGHNTNEGEESDEMETLEEVAKFATDNELIPPTKRLSGGKEEVDVKDAQNSKSQLTYRPLRKGQDQKTKKKNSSSKNSPPDSAPKTGTTLSDSVNSGTSSSSSALKAERERIQVVEQELDALSNAIKDYPKNSQQWRHLQSYLEGAREELNAIRQDIEQPHVIHIIAPSGKNLGLVVDKPLNGGPVYIRSLHPLSPLREQVQLRDKIIAIDDEDVQELSSIEVGKLLCRNKGRAKRKITIVRESDEWRGTISSGSNDTISNDTTTSSLTVGPGSDPIEGKQNTAKDSFTDNLESNPVVRVMEDTQIENEAPPSEEKTREASSRPAAASAPEEKDPLPDVSSMKIKDMKQELESYGVSTKTILEKSDLITALVNARKEEPFKSLRLKNCVEHLSKVGEDDVAVADQAAAAPETTQSSAPTSGCHQQDKSAKVKVDDGTISKQGGGDSIANSDASSTSSAISGFAADQEISKMNYVEDERLKAQEEAVEREVKSWYAERIQRQLNEIPGHISVDDKSTLTPIDEGSAESSSPDDAKSNQNSGASSSTMGRVDARKLFADELAERASSTERHLELGGSAAKPKKVNKDSRSSKSQSPVRPRPGPKPKAHGRAKSLGRSFSSELAHKVKGSGDFGKMLAKRATEVTQKSPGRPAKDSEIQLGRKTMQVAVKVIRPKTGLI